VLSVDFNRGGYASRLRSIIEAEKERSRTEFVRESIRSS